MLMSPAFLRLSAENVRIVVQDGRRLEQIMRSLYCG